MKKLTIKDIKERLKKINPNIEILSTEYKNNSEKLLCKCLIDQNEWLVNWGNLSYGYGCPECGKRKVGESRRIPLEDMREQISKINPNIEILSKTYENGSAKLACKCKKDGYEWTPLWSNLRSGQGCPKCSKNAKLTIVAIKQRIKEISPNIEILTEGEINSETKLNCRCSIDGYEWTPLWGNISRGQGCPKCNGRAVWTIEDIRDELKRISPTIELISDKHENADTKLRFRCLVDNHEWESTWYYARKGHGCPKCNGTNKSNLTIQIVKEKLLKINPNIEILSEEYINGDTKLDCKCKIDGHEWKAAWHNLNAGYGCPKCGGRKSGDSRRLNIDIVKKRLDKINPNIELLSDKYINIYEKLKYKCLIDGCIWETSWDSIQSSGSGCPECRKRNTSGENHHQWKGGVTPLHNHLRSSINEWKVDSKRACGYKCVVTGKRFDTIHHLYGFDSILAETLLVENLPIYQTISEYSDDELKRLEQTCLELHYRYGLGVCVTRKVHKEFHEIYKYGNNTPEQWQEFVEMKQREKAS